MAIIKQYHKDTDTTYVYESISYWDPEKKTSRAKRKLIGRVDPDTGEIIPTDGRNRKKEVLKDDKDYKKLYEKLLQKVEAQNALIESLKKQLSELQSSDH